ncbi:hypothetical protein CsSME_00051217 [Camellia sinensis var. sinensis]
MACGIGMLGSYHAWRSPTPMLMLESIFVLMDNGLEIPMEVNAQGNDDLRSFNLTDELRNCLFYRYVRTVGLLIPKKDSSSVLDSSDLSNGKFWTELFGKNILKTSVVTQNISCVDFWAY